MRTAIIELIDKSNFRTDLVEQKNNREMVEWVNCVLEETDPSEYCIYECVQDFLDTVNDRGVSADSACYMFDYTEFTGSEFVLNTYDDIYGMSLRFCATCVTGVHSADTRILTAKNILAESRKIFGKDAKVSIYGYWNDDDDYRYHIYVVGDKCSILSQAHSFCITLNSQADIKSVVDYCEMEWSMDGTDINQVSCDCDEQCYFDAEHNEEGLIVEPGDNIKVEVSKDEVKETPAEEPKVEEENPEESKKNFPDHSYGRREFAEHAHRIFEDGEAIFHTEVSGKRYIIRGLFDNEDLITHIYDEDTMELVDRRFEVGAQDGADNECEYLTDYFERKFVVDKHWSDSWCMNEKQFNFLKNA